MTTNLLSVSTPEKAFGPHPDAGKIRVLTLHASAEAELGNEALAFYLRPLPDLLLGNTSRTIRLEQSDAGSTCRVSVEIQEAVTLTPTLSDMDEEVEGDTPKEEAEATTGRLSRAFDRAEEVAREARIRTRLDSLQRILADVLGPLKQRVNPVDHSGIFEALAAANERIGQCQQLASAIATDVSRS